MKVCKRDGSRTEVDEHRHREDPLQDRLRDVEDVDAVVGKCAGDRSDDSRPVAAQHGDDGADHYAIAQVSLSIDKTDEKYAELQPLVAPNESKIKSVINDVFGKYTKEEASANTQAIADEILAQLQAMFDSKFIYEVYFRDLKFQ